MSDLKNEIAEALHDASCVCGRPLETHVPLFAETYQFRADAALAVVQKRAEQLAQDLHNRSLIESETHPNARISSNWAFEAASLKIGEAFGLATREESNHG